MDNPLIPTSGQLQFMNDEFGIFFHFGLRTFNEINRDWDMLPMDVHTFQPSALNCDQWMEAVKAAGATYAVMTTKHHDGFAMWPSAYTEFGVKNSGWRDGKGDVVKEFTDACRRHGIKVGLYYSAAQFDTKERSDDYNDYVIGQVTELLTNYGKIDYFWTDSCGSDGFQFDQERITKVMKKLNPDMMCFGSFGERTVGWAQNEWGHSHMDNSYIKTGRFLPIEADCCITRFAAENFWFYNKTYNICRRTVDELIGMYYYSVGRGSNLLLNVAPDRRGLIDDEDIRLLKEMRAELLRRTHECALLSVTGVEKVEYNGHPAYRLLFDRPQLVDTLQFGEDLTQGEHIHGFTVISLPYPHSDCGIEVYQGITVGHKRICTFPPIRAQALLILPEGDGKECITEMLAMYVGSPGLSNRQARG